MRRFSAEQWLAEWETLGGGLVHHSHPVSRPACPAWLGRSHPGFEDARAAALAEEIDSDPAKRLAVLSALDSRELERALVRRGVG